MAVRREKVLLELEDQFTSRMAKAAATTALLHRELDSLSGTSVRTARDSDRVSTSLRNVGTEAGKTSAQLRDGSRNIDRYSGRLGLLVNTAVAVGSAFIPIGGAAIPAVAGLTVGLGAAAAAAGVALVAFNGIGDSLKAIDAYQIEPTTANLEKMRAELDKLGPAGADFARYLDSLDPTLRDLQNLVREGFLPGVEKGIDGLLVRLPELRRFLFDISTELGDLAAGAGEALGGDRFDRFFTFLESDGVRTLHEFARATGFVVEGLANLLAAFAPLSRDFTGGLVSMTQAFAEWSAGLSASDGFRQFIDYLQRTGPRVADLIGQLVMSLAAIAEAGAPIGAVLVPALTAVAKVVETIADSDIGTPLLAGLAAMSALRLATQGWASVSKTTLGGFIAGQGRAAASIMAVTSAQDRARLSAQELAAVEQTRTRASLASMGRLAAAAAGLAIASTGAADGLGLSNTAMLGLTGTMLGPWGAAGGAALGLTMDIAAANNDLETAIRSVDAAIESGAGYAELRAQLEALDAQIQSTNETFSKFNPFSIDLSHPLKSLADNAKGWVAGVNELFTGTEELAEAKRDEAQAALLAKGAEERHAAAMNLTTRIARQTRTEIDGLVAAMEEQTSAALGAFDAVTQYAQALMEARKQAEKSSVGIDLNRELTRKQRVEVIANRDALSQLAGAWNNQSDAVRNNVDKWHEARKAFIDTAVAMGAPEKKAKELADRLMEIPRSVAVKIEADNDPALRAIRDVKAEMAALKDKTVRLTYYVNHVNAGNVQRGGGRDGDPSTPYDVGGFTGYGSRRQVAGIVHAGEVVLPQDVVRRDKAHLMARYGYLPNMSALPGFADGGFAAGARRSLDDQLAIAQVMQQIRDLRRSLRADGKDKLEGLNRRIAELELRKAEKELKLAQTREQREARQAARERAAGIRAAGAGLSFDSLLPQEPQTVAQGVRGEIDAFKQEILDAGGVWTKELRSWAKDMMATARQYDATTAAIEAETAKRDALVETLNQQQAQLDDLNRTMEAFGAQVASNFLNDPFNQSRTVTVSGDPAAVAALAQAQAQLAAVQAGGGPGAAAQASRLMQQIALLQGPASSSEQTLTGLDAFRNVVEGDTANALAFAAALQQAVDRGLDPTGGLFAELAAKGDLTTAQQLAGLSPTEIDQFEAMFKAREDAAAQVAAMTTQAVYGEQQAMLQAQIDNQNQLIAAVDATLVVLNATQAVLGEQVRAGSEAGVALLGPEIDDLKQTVKRGFDGLPRELQRLIRKEN